MKVEESNVIYTYSYLNSAYGFGFEIISDWLGWKVIIAVRTRCVRSLRCHSRYSPHLPTTGTRQFIRMPWGKWTLRVVRAGLLLHRHGVTAEPDGDKKRSWASASRSLCRLIGWNLACSDDITVCLVYDACRPAPNGCTTPAIKSPSFTVVCCPHAVCFSRFRLRRKFCFNEVCVPGVKYSRHVVHRWAIARFRWRLKMPGTLCHLRSELRCIVTGFVLTAA